MNKDPPDSHKKRVHGKRKSADVEYEPSLRQTMTEKTKRKAGPKHTDKGAAQSESSDDELVEEFEHELWVLASVCHTAFSGHNNPTFPQTTIVPQNWSKKVFALHGALHQRLALLAYTTARKDIRVPELDIELFKVAVEGVVVDKSTPPMAKLFQFSIQHMVNGIPGKKLFLATESAKDRTNVVQKITRLIESLVMSHHSLEFSMTKTPMSNLSIISKMNLIQCAISGNLDGVTYLLPALPIDQINGKTHKGLTALICASREGHVDIVQALVNVKGINVNEQDEDGYTALHAASLSGHSAIVGILLAHSADPSLKSKCGETASDICVGMDACAVWTAYNIGKKGPEKIRSSVSGGNISSSSGNASYNKYDKTDKSEKSEKKISDDDGNDDYDENDDDDDNDDESDNPPMHVQSAPTRPNVFLQKTTVLNDFTLSHFGGSVGSLVHAGSNTAHVDKKVPTPGAPVGFLPFIPDKVDRSVLLNSAPNPGHKKEFDVVKKAATPETAQGAPVGFLPFIHPATESNISTDVGKPGKTKQLKQLNEVVRNKNLIIEDLRNKVKHYQEVEANLNNIKKKWLATTGFEITENGNIIGNVGSNTTGTTTTKPSNNVPSSHSLSSAHSESFSVTLHDLERLQVSVACALVARGDLSALKVMLAQGADVLHRVNYDRRTVLNTAVKYNQIKCVEFLIGVGASLNKEDDGKETARRSPLEDALKYGHAEVALMLEEAMTKQTKYNLFPEFSEYIPMKLEKKVSMEKKIKGMLYPDENTLKRQSEKKEESSGKKTHREENTSTDFRNKTSSPATKRKEKKRFNTDRPGGATTTTALRKMFLQFRGRTKETEKENVEPELPIGEAFGFFRGKCSAPGCECQYFKGECQCECGHFPASHRNLGKSDALELPDIADENSTQILIRKQPDKEWPKVLNPQMATYIGLIDVQNHLKASKEKQEWFIEANEVEFEGELGKGTSARVYKGTYLGQLIAVKVMEFSVAGKQKDKQISDLIQEFDIMTKIKHDHLVKMYGVIIEPQICMVIEYCEHGSMYDLIRKESFAVEWPLLFKWCKESIAGLAVLHGSDPPIVHRDVKTLNLLLGADYTVKVADFGLSRFVDTGSDLATLNKLRGTYIYTAPEVYFGNQYTSKADVFSLAIVFWELVVKCVEKKYVMPYSEFGMVHDFQIIIQVAKKDIRPTIPANVPKFFSHLLKILWRSKAANRPEMKQLLEMIISIENHYKEHKDLWEQTRNGKEIDFQSSLSITFPEVPELPVAAAIPTGGSSNQVPNLPVHSVATLNSEPSPQRVMARTKSLSDISDSGILSAGTREDKDQHQHTLFTVSSPSGRLIVSRSKSQGSEKPKSDNIASGNSGITEIPSEVNLTSDQRQSPGVFQVSPRSSSTSPSASPLTSSSHSPAPTPPPPRRREQLQFGKLQQSPQQLIGGGLLSPKKFMKKSSYGASGVVRSVSSDNVNSVKISTMPELSILAHSIESDLSDDSDEESDSNSSTPPKSLTKSQIVSHVTQHIHPKKSPSVPDKKKKIATSADIETTVESSNSSSSSIRLTKSNNSNKNYDNNNNNTNNNINKIDESRSDNKPSDMEAYKIKVRPKSMIFTPPLNDINNAASRDKKEKRKSRKSFNDDDDTDTISISADNSVSVKDIKKARRKSAVPASLANFSREFKDNNVTTLTLTADTPSTKKLQKYKEKKDEKKDQTKKKKEKDDDKKKEKEKKDKSKT